MLYSLDRWLLESSQMSRRNERWCYVDTTYIPIFMSFVRFWENKDPVFKPWIKRVSMCFSRPGMTGQEFSLYHPQYVVSMSPYLSPLDSYTWGVVKREISTNVTIMSKILIGCHWKHDGQNECKPHDLIWACNCFQCHIKIVL